MINFFRVFNTCGLLLYCAASHAQPLSLNDCHALAVENYPTVKRRDLIAKSATYSIANANTDYLPQLTVNGQATYQSVVTKIPLQIPGIDVPLPDKDQYKIYGELNQLLYDGGATRLKKEAVAIKADIESQALAVTLYAIKARINELYFGILLLDAQLAQNSVLIKDIQAGLSHINGAINNGAALKSSGSLFEAELLKAAQQTVELRTKRNAYLQMLSLFIGRPLSESTLLEKPVSVMTTQEINRPELKWYNQQQLGIEIEDKMLSAKNLPKLHFFFQGGAGRPALNMLSNNFEAYYYTGIQLSFPLTGFYTLKKDRALLTTRAQEIEVQKETFLFNTNLSLSQYNTEIEKYSKLLDTDSEIIALRTSVKQAALAQLENGVINTADYMREVNAEDAAKLAKILHEIQWLSAQYRIRNITGN